MIRINKQQGLQSLQYVFFGSLLLYWGKNLFIPLSLAVFISFVLYPVCKWFEGRGFSRGAATGISFLILLILSAGLLFLFSMQIISFSSEWPLLKEKILASIGNLQSSITSNFRINAEEQLSWLKNAIANSGLFSILGAAAYASGIWIVFLVLIPLFSILILNYRSLLVQAVFRLFPADDRPEVLDVLRHVVHTYYNFIKGMLLVYLIVGILNSIGLWMLGIPHPFLFGFIASVLTFIPYIGIIVSSLLPITVAWLSFDSIMYPLGVIGVFTLVQYLEANVIFPLAVSSRIKVNPLATLISMLLGGIIWGAAGMILFIPFLAILKLISDHSPSLASLSKLLGVNDTATQKVTAIKDTVLE